MAAANASAIAQPATTVAICSSSAIALGFSSIDGSTNHAESTKSDSTAASNAATTLDANEQLEYVRSVKQSKLNLKSASGRPTITNVRRAIARSTVTPVPHADKPV